MELAVDTRIGKVALLISTTVIPDSQHKTTVSWIVVYSVLYAIGLVGDFKVLYLPVLGCGKTCGYASIKT